MPKSNKRRAVSYRIGDILRRDESKKMLLQLTTAVAKVRSQLVPSRHTAWRVDDINESGGAGRMPHEEHKTRRGPGWLRFTGR